MGAEAEGNYTPTEKELAWRYQQASRNRFGNTDPARKTNAEFMRGVARIRANLLREIADELEEKEGETKIGRWSKRPRPVGGMFLLDAGCLRRRADFIDGGAS